MTNRYAYVVLIATAALLVLGGAGAQRNVASAPSRAGDIKYCQTLAQRYTAQRHVMESPNASVSAAINNCQSDPEGSLATLTRAMQDEKITIPPRS